jgi:hypothetical protein
LSLIALPASSAALTASGASGGATASPLTSAALPPGGTELGMMSFWSVFSRASSSSSVAWRAWRAATSCSCCSLISARALRSSLRWAAISSREVLICARTSVSWATASSTSTLSSSTRAIVASS